MKFVKPRHAKFASLYVYNYINRPQKLQSLAVSTLLVNLRGLHYLNIFAFRRYEKE